MNVSGGNHSWGRKSLLLIGFGALPIRGAFFTTSNNEVWLVSLQVLDGVAAGTLDALIPLVLANVMLGTGRTMQRCAPHRARDSGLAEQCARRIPVVTFLALSTVGVVPWLVLLAAMPETGRNAGGRKAALAPTG